MKFVPLIFITAIFVSCFNQGDCLITATNLMQIQFKKKSNHTLDTIVTFAQQSIVVPGADSVLVVKLATAALLLPLDINNNTTTFIFHRINADSSITATDTLQLGYVRQSKIISQDCGAFTYFNDLKFLKTNLDSAQIKFFNTSLLKDPTNSGITAYAVTFQIFY